jgi:Polyketide cyclase / dehydrase and lipid transport
MYHVVHVHQIAGALAMKTTITAERHLSAPADVLYACIANYRAHHRPGGFLPDAFSDLQIHAGGIGAGTEVSWVITTGGRPRAIRATISEPVPGRRLVETADGIETTFDVEPEGTGALVRFTTVIDEGGLQGLLTRLFGPRLIGPVYDEELANLEAYARRLSVRAA